MDFSNFHSPFQLPTAYSSAVKQLRIILKAKSLFHHLNVPKGYFEETEGTKVLEVTLCDAKMLLIRNFLVTEYEWNPCEQASLQPNSRSECR